MYHPENELVLNDSSNESLHDIIDRVDANRRRFVQGSLGSAMLAAFGGFTVAGLPRFAEAAPPPVGGIGFAGIPASTAPGMFDGIKVPAGYTVKVLYPWGDPIGHLSGSPAYDPNNPQTEARQLLQAGMNHDGMRFFPFPAVGAGGVSSERGLLVVNHEYTDEGLLHHELNPGAAPMTFARARISQAAHGVSIIEIRRMNGEWKVVRPSPLARRITGFTPMKITGPAAGHPALRTNYVDHTGAVAGDPSGTSVLGTLNNCAHGFTPWGTYLTCEENWNGYFGADVPIVQTPNERRYGVNASGFGYRWHLGDFRFDIRKNPNEQNRFGWVVEIDPWNPNSVPCKRTALGRTKHEGAWSVVGADNKVAVYLGDDERNEYMYKFCCAKRYTPGNRLANKDLLDSGTLYVAKFNADGSGAWLPLVWNQNGLTPENGFSSQADVLIRCREAADRVGATMMDRPEWVAVHPSTREAYLTLTNNNRRGSNPPSVNAADGTTGAGSARPPVDAANPRPDNRYGHIIRWREAGGDVCALSFEWDIFVECGDRLDVQANHQGNIVGDDLGAPDGLWFDKDGRLWIQTDQAGDGLGDWVKIGANTMSCADPSTKEIRRFLTSPPNCEVTGVDTTPDGKTMFVNIQHPGEDWVGSFTQKSTWPDNANNGSTSYTGAQPPPKPRAATIVITRDDGGVIGGA